MLYFFSFCCLIGKQSENELMFALNLLIKSLEKYVKDFKFIIYTNFNFHIDNNKIIIRKYYTHKNNIDLTEKNNNEWVNKWKNLSMNKIFIYNDLYQEFNKDFIWIDLDTYIYDELSFMYKYDNYFIQQGGNFDFMENISSDFQIKWPLSIQGNFFKLNNKLYHNLIELLHLLHKKKIKLSYDSQSLFTYYFYKILNNNLEAHNINISGKTVQTNILNSVSIWCPETKQSFATKDGLDNLYLENNILKSKYHPNKEIQIVSFTFHTMMNVKNEKKFIQLFIESNNIKKWYIYKKHFILKENYLVAKNKSFLKDSMEHSSIVKNKIQININDKVNFSVIKIINADYFEIIMK